MRLGRHQSEETRAKVSAALMGHIASLESRAKMSASHIGKKASLESRTKMSRAKIGGSVSEETRVKMFAAQNRPEVKAKKSAALKGKSNGRKGILLSSETRAKIGLANSNPSVETRAKISMGHKGKPAWNKGIPITKEQKEKSSIAHKGRVSWNKGIPISKEQKIKLSMAHTGKKASSETKAKMSAIHKGPLSWQWKGGRRISARRANAKRRDLGFNPLNVPLPYCEAHHINKVDVIYMLKAVHQSIKHNFWTGKNMNKVNAEAYNFLFKQEAEAALCSGSQQNQRSSL